MNFFGNFKGINCLPWAMLTIPLSDGRKRLTEHVSPHNRLRILCIEDRYVICPYLFPKHCIYSHFPRHLWLLWMKNTFVSILISHSVYEEHL